MISHVKQEGLASALVVTAQQMCSFVASCLHLLPLEYAMLPPTQCRAGSTPLPTYLLNSGGIPNHGIHQHSFTGTVGRGSEAGCPDEMPPTPMLASQPWTPLRRAAGGSGPISTTFTGVLGSNGAQPWDVGPSPVQGERQGATILVRPGREACRQSLVCFVAPQA